MGIDAAGGEAIEFSEPQLPGIFAKRRMPAVAGDFATARKQTLPKEG